MMGIDQLTPDVQEFAGRSIQAKARQIAGRGSFSPSDREDIAQDLWLHLIDRLKHYDADKGSIFAFIKTVVGRRAASILRDQVAGKRDAHRCGSLNASIRTEDGKRAEVSATLTEDADTRLGKRTVDRQHCSDRTLDMSEFLAGLPEELRDLCQRLQTQSLTEISRETGVPRSTLCDSVRRLRERFEEAGLRNYF